MAFPPRSKPRVVIAGAQPLLSPPMTLNSGARGSSKKSSQKPDAPDICLRGWTRTPFSVQKGTNT